MELLAKILNGFQLLTVLTKTYILDVWLGSEYASHKNLSVMIMKLIDDNVP